ncbi:MAG: phosphatidate cytidylyltransferase [Acidobacteriota bacterium]|nr:phosphatidate cytidylyltransferase [Acidobacteriota bacterium]MDH3786270.1 phosphatidate cytidylyltransferase [Acidobacteriota bacterium]
MRDPIFLRYLTIIGGVLLAAGLILTFVTFVLRKRVASIWATYRGWWIMAPLVVVFIGLGRQATIVGVTLLALMGFREFARATGLSRDRTMSGLVYAGILALGTLTLVEQPRTGLPGWYGLYMAAPAYFVAIVLLVPILRNRARGQLQTVALTILSFIYLGWMFGHLGFLANTPHSIGYLLFVVFAVEVNDVAAFTFGKMFGRRPLRSEISPNKTVEGSLGALAVSMLLPWLLQFSFPHFGTRDLLLTGLIVGVGGQLGDLAISFIKRDLGTKDMGTLLPGHGGILDRIDSLIFVAPLLFHMIRWFHGLR